jgi:hypothetical protein
MTDPPAPQPNQLPLEPADPDTWLFFRQHRGRACLAGGLQILRQDRMTSAPAPQ